MIAFLLLRRKQRITDVDRLLEAISREESDYDEDEDTDFLEEYGGATVGIVRSWAGNGFAGKILAGIAAIVIMGLNAFLAAIATQVYKIFTGRWKAGGGSDIPVLTTAPGGGSGSGSSTGASTASGNVSSDFLNRYRD
jgi:hypothetical protein